MVRSKTKIAATWCAILVTLAAALWPQPQPVGTVHVLESEVRLVDDDTWAIMTIMGEAAGEPLLGKIAVAEVIRNRMKRKYASDGTVIGTVLRAKQFSMWDDRARLLAARVDDDSPVVQDCIRAWKESAGSNITRGAVLYHTTTIDLPAWATAPSVEKVTTIHRHIFYSDEQGA